MNLSCSVTEIVTSSPVGLQLTPLRQNALLGIFYRNITWYPSQYQVGQQLFCFKAKDSAGYLSWHFFCNAHSKEIINFKSSCFVVPRNNIYYPEMSCDLEVINTIVKMTSHSQRRKSWCHVWNLPSCSIDKYCMLSCSFEKMIDRRNKLKALTLSCPRGSPLTSKIVWR